MISLLPAQRRAEEFAALVDEDADQRGHSARNADLFEVVEAMRAVEAPSARPEFVSDLRAQLMAEADVALSAVDSKLALPAHPRSRRDRRIAVAAGAAVLVGATSSVAFASQGALPGDTLYPVKRAIEGVHSSLSLDEGAKAETVLNQATGRLSELQSLARQVDASNAEQLPNTLDDFASKADQGADLVLDRYADNADPEPVSELRTFVDDSMKTLVSLDALIPAAATDSLNHAAKVLSEINDRIAAACPTCAVTVLEVPARLMLALRTTDSTPQVTPPSSSDGNQSVGGEPNQAIDPNQVVEIPKNLLENVLPTSPQTPPPNKDGNKGPRQPGDDDPVKKTVEGTVDKVGDTLEKGNRALLGDEDGLLGPVLNPLLDPLLGKNGLLSGD